MNRFRRSESGVALIEFAILFPFFFLLLFGGIEVTRMLLIQQRLERAGYVLADITTQYLPATVAQASGELTQAEMVANVFPQLSRIMHPYDAPERQAIIVTSLQQDGGKVRIAWQIASTGDTLTGCDGASPRNCVTSMVNGLSPGAISPAVTGTQASLPQEAEGMIAAMADQSNVIVSEVFYYYQPILESLLRRTGDAGGGASGFSFALPPRIYVKRTFFAPRNGAMFFLPPAFPAS